MKSIEANTANLFLRVDNGKFALGAQAAHRLTNWMDVFALGEITDTLNYRAITGLRMRW